MPIRWDVEEVLLMKQDKKAILVVTKNTEVDFIMWVSRGKYVGGDRFEKVVVVLSLFGILQFVYRFT